MTSRFLSSKNMVLFVCSGVGHINRGYETHMIDLFDTLIKEGYSNLYFLKGAGESNNYYKRINCIKRDSKLAKLLHKIFGKPEYFVEQISFFIGSIISIINIKPKVIYCPDFTLLRLFVIFKRIFNFQFQTILCNGGNYKPPYFGIDIVQFILPKYAEEIKFENKVVIPHGFDCLKYVPHKTKLEYRDSLGLPKDKFILLSVGAINKTVKRMDYIIEEVAALNSDNIFLLMIGQKDDESTFIEEFAKNKLEINYKILTINYTEIQDYYLASDAFCLASLQETFGKVYVEAGLAGLPIFVHDFDTSRQVLSNFAYFGDLSQKGVLCHLLTNNILNKSSKFDAVEMKTYLKNKYTWDCLINSYSELLKIV
ncbi:MAG: glycosyltransferase [Saprospiraceae bacterium]